MVALLIFLLALYQLQTSTYSEIVEAPQFSLNSITTDDQHQQPQAQKFKDEDLAALLSKELAGGNGLNDDILTNLVNGDDSVPLVKSGYDHTELEFKYPITSVNIDYAKNMIVLKFRKPYVVKKPLTPEEEERLRAIQDSFIRFGRSSGDFMRFGKRTAESTPRSNSYGSFDYGFKQLRERSERSSDLGRGVNLGMRDPRGDNFMRFGRTPSADFMRLGRIPSADFIRFGRMAPGDFMRFGRGGGPNDFMRFGRGGGQNDFMRFGRSPSDFIRFGRNPNNKDFMRFGRASNEKSTRDEASNQNFIRFGRPENFMRFGKSLKSHDDSSSSRALNETKPSLQKSDVKAAAKFLKQTEPDGDESNPMDKAIKVLFSNEGKSLENIDSNVSNEIMSNEQEY